MKWIRVGAGLLGVELEPGDLPGEAYTHLLCPGEVAWSRNGRVRICIAAEAVVALGDQGRLLGDDKVEVIANRRGEEVLFNACIFNPAGTEIWFGDISLPADVRRLEELAAKLGEIYLTPELPYRWEGLPQAPALDPRIRRFAG